MSIFSTESRNMQHFGGEKYITDFGQKTLKECIKVAFGWVRVIVSVF
jgi:hypothetical protein